MSFKLGSIYFAALGAVILVFGGLEFILAVLGKEIEVGILVVPGDIWKGFILFSAGAILMAGATKLRDIHGLGQAMLGSIMLWIVAGCEIFARITESIPGGEEGGWFNSLYDFLGTYGPPYCPALFLFPFSLLIIYFVAKSK